MFKIDTSEKKIGSFISAIITLLFAGIVGYVCYNLSVSINETQGLESLSKIVTIPMLIICYLVLTALVISSAISSCFAIFSSVMAIKIISIILLLLCIGIMGLEIYGIKLVI